MVETVQLAITLGASLSGLLFNASGYRSTFAVSAGLLCASAPLALVSWRGVRAGHDQGCSSRKNI